MSRFWPGIRKQDERAADPHFGRQGFEKQPPFSPEKMKVAQPGSIALAAGAFDSLAYDIDSDATQARMGHGVSGEKMAMSATEFPDKLPGVAQCQVEFASERGATLGQNSEIFPTGGALVHARPPRLPHPLQW